MKKTKKCPYCGEVLEVVWVSTEGAKNKSLTYQCGDCYYVKYDKKTSDIVIKELREKRLALEKKEKPAKLPNSRRTCALIKA